MTSSREHGSSGTPSARTRRLPSLAAAAIGVLTGFLLMNLSVAAFLLFSPGNRDDPALGDVPNSGPQVFGTEGYSISRVNSLGMRGGEISPRKAGARVLFVGDSYTQALQMSDSETFVARVGQLLSQQATSAVECVNAGRPGANCADFLALANTYETRVRPTYVVVQLDEGSFFTATRRPARGWWLKPEPNGWAIQRAYPPKDLPELGRTFLAKLPLPYLLWQRMKASAVQDAPGSGSPANRAPVAARTANRADPTLSETMDTRLVEWAISRLAESYGANLTILYLPTSIRYDRDSTSSPTPTELEVARVCQQQSVDMMNPRAQVEAEFRRTGQPLSGFANTQPGTGHLNAEGDRIVAEVLAEHLKSRRIAAAAR